MQRPYKTIQATLLKLGLIPPDTPFNRRAQQYADYAAKLAAAEKQRVKHHKPRVRQQPGSIRRKDISK